MDKPKPMSAREYRAHAEQKLAEDKSQPTEIVTMTSGSVWELRRPDLSRYIFSGRLPQNFLMIGKSAWKNGTPADQLTRDLVGGMSDKEFLESAIFLRDIISDCTVNPHIAYPAEGDNDIDPKDVLTSDRNEILKWINSHMGVAGVTGLQSFRGKRKRTPRNKPNGKEIQPTSESTATN